MAEQSILEILLNLRKTGSGGKDAEQDLKRLKTASTEVGQAAERLNLGMLAVQGALLMAGVAALRSVPAMIQLGDSYNRSQLALAAYAGGAGEAERATLAVERAAGHAIDRLTATQVATKLFSMGLAQNADDAERLAKIAVTLGAAVGRDAKSSFEDFSLMLANQSILRLDQFGLSSGRVRQRIIELMEANSGLTREMAFQAAVVEMGTEKLAQLEEAGFQATNSVERMRAEIENAKLGVATFLADGLLPIIDGFYGLRDAIDEQRNRLVLGATDYEDYIDQLSKMSGAQQFLIGQVDEATFNEMRQAEAAREAAAATEEFTGATLDLALAQEEAKYQMDQLHQLMSIDLTRDLEAVREKIAEQQEQIVEWRGRVAELEGMSYLTDEQRGELDGLREKIGEAEEKVGDLEEAWDRQTKQLIFKLAEQQLAVDGLTQEEINALTRLAGPEGFGLIDQAAVDLVFGITELSGVMDASGDQSAEFVDKLIPLQGEMSNAARDADDLSGSLQAIQSKEVTVTTTYVTRNIQQYMQQNLGVIQAVRSAQGGFLQHGGEFDVKGPPGPDRVPVNMHLTAGERVTVTPRGGLAPTSGGRGEGPLIGQVNVNNQMDAILLAHLIKRELG